MLTSSHRAHTGIPVMISILVAKTLADALEPKGIYDLVIELSGLPYLDAKTTYTWRGYSVRDVMETNVDRIALDEDNTIANLRRKVDEGQEDGGFPIVVQEGKQISVSDFDVCQRLGKRAAGCEPRLCTEMYSRAEKVCGTSMKSCNTDDDLSLALR